MFWKTAIIFVLGLLASPALAGVDFQPYEGRDTIAEGQGGTRVSKHGIDYWTMGTPPRRYQVIGIIVDTRKNGRFNGNTIGSETIAKKVLAAGGNAVIVHDSDSRQTGTFNTGQAYASGGTVFGSGTSIAITQSTTRLIVVKYID